MANRAYLRVWTRNFSEKTLIEQFVRFLATVPVHPSAPEFTQLVVQPIDPSEVAIAEWDLRGQGFGAAEVAALAAQHLHSDTVYFVSAQWELWQFDAEVMRWQNAPAELQLACYGPDFDAGAAEATGNFEATLGLEHLYTGHGGLLASEKASQSLSAPEDAVEHRFSRWMTADANLREYHLKTRENIQQLFDWMAAIERALPVERTELWSEGEDNFEARLDAILAQR